MRYPDVITKLTLDRVVDALPSGSEYLGMLVDFIRMVDARGAAGPGADEVRSAQRRLAAAQARYLLSNDTPEGFYREAFSNVGIDAGQEELDPALFLDKMAYHAADLVGGRAQRLRLVSRGLRGGRVFQSSGTTNPENKKKTYYDAVTVVLLRELNRLGWESATRTKSTRGTRSLLLIPEAAKVAMPFGALVSDMMAASGARVYWGARFVKDPEVVRDETFGVLTADLQFKDNVRPSKLSVTAYNVASKLRRRGDVVVFGLLPSVHAVVEATREKRGIAGFFARPRPTLIGFGGGLKRMGIPPDVRRSGEDAVRAYLEGVAETTGADAGHLREMDAGDKPEHTAALDEILTVYLTKKVEDATGARCLNIFAGAEIQPSFFSVGSLRQVYGNDCYRVSDGKPRRDIFVPAPGVGVQLRDPVDGTAIPPSETGRPGVLRLWNPYNVSHLHVIETEDMLAWAPIPETAPNRPAYAGGVGLGFRGRVAGASGAGYCA